MSDLDKMTLAELQKKHLDLLADVQFKQKRHDINESEAERQWQKRKESMRELNAKKSALKEVLQVIENRVFAEHRKGNPTTGMGGA